MSRRWVVQVRPPTRAVGGLYLCVRPDETLPVTIPYATKFITKRAGETEAKSRGLADFVVMRTWW